MYRCRQKSVSAMKIFLVATTCTVLLSACEKPAPSPAATLRDSFELVLETRPEQATAYHFPTQTAYDLCAAGAAALKLPVTPFVSLTDDYVIERRTVISDGASRFDTTESFFIDLNGMDMKTGCVTSLKSVSTTEVHQEGKVQKSNVTADGVFHAKAPVTAPARSGTAAADAAEYTVSKKHKGHALRCLPTTHPSLGKKVLLDSCIYDAGESRTFTDASEAPIVVYARMQAPHVTAGPAHTLVTEPRVVKSGKAVDATAFRFVAAKP